VRVVKAKRRTNSATAKFTNAVKRQNNPRRRRRRRRNPGIAGINKAAIIDFLKLGGGATVATVASAKWLNLLVKEGPGKALVLIGAAFAAKKLIPDRSMSTGAQAVLIANAIKTLLPQNIADMLAGQGDLSQSDVMAIERSLMGEALQQPGQRFGEALPGANADFMGETLTPDQMIDMGADQFEAVTL
jgi:hypothetical protein